MAKQHYMASSRPTSDAYDQAERGSHIDLADLPTATKPLKTNEPLFMRRSRYATSGTTRDFPSTLKPLKTTEALSVRCSISPAQSNCTEDSNPRPPPKDQHIPSPTGNEGWQQYLCRPVFPRLSPSTIDGTSHGSDTVNPTQTESPTTSQRPSSQRPTDMGLQLWREWAVKLKSRNFPSDTSESDTLKAYQPGYDKFQYDFYADYPQGWPRMAAFLDSADSFSIYRRFGQIHSRLLLIHMTEITKLEKQLADLDKSDEKGDAWWRLKTTNFQEGWDATQRNLHNELEERLLRYDAILLNQKHLKALDQTPAKDHDSVFKWIWQNKPVDNEEFEWIFRPDDFVSLVPQRRNRFEDFIRARIDTRPNSWLKSFAMPKKQRNKSQYDPRVKFFSTARISLMGRLIVVCIAVIILLVPVILFLLTSMSRVSMSVVVLVFVFIFSAMMSLLTDAGVEEIFVGTSTYCAVLVTFLGNLQSSGG